MSSLLSKIQKKGIALPESAQSARSRTSIVLAEREPSREGLLAELLGLRQNGEIYEQALASFVEATGTVADVAPWWLTDPPKSTTSLESLIPAARLILSEEASKHSPSADLRIDIRHAVSLATQKLSSSMRILPSDIKLATQELVALLLGKGPLEALYKDPLVTEIFVDSHDSIRCLRLGQAIETPFCFRSFADYESYLLGLVHKIGARFSQQNPLVEGLLEDDWRSRIKIVHGGLRCASQPALSIKLARLQYPSLYDLIRSQTLPASLAAWLSEIVSLGELSVLVVGPPGSGKTTLLSALLGAVGSNQRIRVLEDLPELQFAGCQGERMLSSAKKTLESLGSVSDPSVHREIYGDLKTSNIPDFLNAIHSGLSGSMAAMQADSADEALWQCVESVNRNLHLASELSVRKVASAVKLIIVTGLLEGRAYIEEIVEVVPSDTGGFNTTTLIEYEGDVNGRRRWRQHVQNSPTIDMLEERGVQLAPASNLVGFEAR